MKLIYRCTNCRHTEHTLINDWTNGKDQYAECKKCRCIFTPVKPSGDIVDREVKLLKKGNGYTLQLKEQGEARSYHDTSIEIPMNEKEAQEAKDQFIKVLL